MATVKDVITLLFGPSGVRPKELAEYDEAIAKAEAESAIADAAAGEHTRRAEFLAAEAAFDESGELAERRVQKERDAAATARERAGNIRSVLTGLRRRRGELVARRAETERAAYVEAVRAKLRQIKELAGRISEKLAELALLWKELSTALAQLHNMMPNTVAVREIAIATSQLSAMAPREQPNVRAATLDVEAVTLRAIGVADDKERAA